MNANLPVICCVGLSVVLSFAVTGSLSCRVEPVQPNQICNLLVAPGDADCSGEPHYSPGLRFYHQATPDVRGPAGCRPFQYQGCGANVNSYIVGIECISYCQLFRDLPLRSDILFAVSHNAADDQPLLTEDFRLSLYPVLADFVGCIDEAYIEFVTVERATQSEIKIGFRIERGSRLEPYEASMALAANMDNGEVTWQYQQITLVAIPTQRYVDHYNTRTDIKSHNMLMYLMIVGTVLAIVGLLCLGCLIKVKKSLKMRLTKMRQTLIIERAAAASSM